MLSMENAELAKRTKEYINWLEDYKNKIDKESKSINLTDAKSLWVLSTKIDVVVKSLEEFFKYI